MNTHLLIPISFVKDAENGNWSYQDAIYAGKQISLNEKDKDFYKSRAKKSLNENFFDTIQGGEIHCYIQGYKQALLDLL